jgi:isorenieratene synthase
MHCYAIPDRVVDDAELRQLLLDEMIELFPELAGARIVSEHLYVRDDFPAFHVGMAAQRPEVETPVRGLLLAGDWVKLPYPSMLMEAACVAGLLSANAILRAHGLREEAVFSVPAKGVLAGLPERPSASAPPEREPSSA